MTRRDELLQEIAAKADSLTTRSAIGEMSPRRKLLRAEQVAADVMTSEARVVRAAALACAAWALLALEALDLTRERP